MRTPSSLRGFRSLLVAMPVVAFAGCGGPVSVADPSLQGEQADSCATVMAELPEYVADQERRETEPGRLSAAWGDPAIVLVCGAELPPEAGPDAQCFEVNGVGWYAEEAEAAWQFTTLGRAVPVQVTVPRSYSPEADALVDLAQPIADHTENVQPCV